VRQKSYVSSNTIAFVLVDKITKKRHRHNLKEKEAKRFLLEVSTKIGVDIEQFMGSKPRVEVSETETADVFIFNGRPLLAKSNGQLFLTLSFETLFPLFPKIVVDMGAVPYVCKGADVMAPGVRSINGEFKKNDLILVVDERHDKPLAVGLALCSSEEMKTVNHGKIVKNLHYVGDKLWNNLKGS